MSGSFRLRRSAITASLVVLGAISGANGGQAVNLSRTYEANKVTTYQLTGAIDTSLGRILVEGVLKQKVNSAEADGTAIVENELLQMMMTDGKNKSPLPAMPPAQFVMDAKGQIIRDLAAKEADSGFVSLAILRYVSVLAPKLEVGKDSKVSAKDPVTKKTKFEGVQKLIRVTDTQAIIEAKYDVISEQPKGKAKMKALTTYDAKTGEVLQTDVEMTDLPIDKNQQLSVEGLKLSLKKIDG